MVCSSYLLFVWKHTCIFSNYEYILIQIRLLFLSKSISPSEKFYLFSIVYPIQSIPEIIFSVKLIFVICTEGDCSYNDIQKHFSEF